MSNAANKARGSLYERQLEEYINGEGVKCRRLPRAGSKDIGDLAIEFCNGHVIVLEAKNVKAVNMADFLRQAEVEADNYEDKYDTLAYPMVVVKARQKPVADSRVTIRLEDLLSLLRWEGVA